MFYVCPCKNMKESILLFPLMSSTENKTRGGHFLMYAPGNHTSQKLFHIDLNWHSIFRQPSINMYYFHGNDVNLNLNLYHTFLLLFNPDLCFFSIDLYELLQKFVLKSLLNHSFECSFCLQHDYIWFSISFWWYMRHKKLDNSSLLPWANGTCTFHDLCGLEVSSTDFWLFLSSKYPP